MPVFDYICGDCKKKLENEYVVHYKDDVICPRCKTKMNKLFPNKMSHGCFPNGGVHLEHVSPNGETFHTKKEMSDYAKKNNLELGALL